MADDIRELVERYGRRIDPILEEEFPEGAYEFLSEGARYQLASGGKRLRPALCLLACEGLGGAPEAAMPFACASEILHNLFLLHDDIEDGDRTRRNRDTLWVRYGIPNAINVGDFLAAKAYGVLLKSPVPSAALLDLLQVFTDTYLVTTRGQALDINLRASADLTLEGYLEIVSLKTARYLAYNMVGGAIAAGAGPDLRDRFWKVGEYLGPAFQIQDDVLDLTEGKGRGGVIGCDIREGKPTIFMAYVLRNRQGDPDTKRLLAVLGKAREETTPDDVTWAIDFYRRSGAIAFASDRARELATEAEARLEEIPLSNRDIFTRICRFVVERAV
jgi:geranylgeranyl pyrophosphate synthase